MITIEDARIEDADRISGVLIASITELCDADHKGDAQLIASWTGNKTPDHIRRWIGGSSGLRVARVGGEVAGVGGLRTGGQILLNYVAPEFRKQGVSRALLSEMEGQIVAQGIKVGRLTSTLTAMDFYRRHGWFDADRGRPAFGLPGIPMRKTFSG